jgi:hypothetical protein
VTRRWIAYLRLTLGSAISFVLACKSCAPHTERTQTAALKWLSGEDQVRVFNLPSTRHRNSFCSTCGSALPDLQMNGALLKVPTGSLDTEVRVRPDAHIFCASKASWDEALDKVSKAAKLPDWSTLSDRDPRINAALLDLAASWPSARYSRR